MLTRKTMLFSTSFLCKHMICGVILGLAWECLTIMHKYAFLEKHKTSSDA